MNKNDLYKLEELLMTNKRASTKVTREALLRWAEKNEDILYGCINADKGEHCHDVNDRCVQLHEEHCDDCHLDCRCFDPEG